MYKDKNCHTLVPVARLTISNTGIMMMESFAMEVWTSMSVRVLIPNSQTGVREQGIVHALDHEVVQQVPVYNKENSEARDAERRGQDVRGCSEVEAPKQPTCSNSCNNRENSIVYNRGFIPNGTGIYISNKMCCNHCQ